MKLYLPKPQFARFGINQLISGPGDAKKSTLQHPKDLSEPLPNSSIQKQNHYPQSMAATGPTATDRCTVAPAFHELDQPPGSHFVGNAFPFVFALEKYGK